MMEPSTKKEINPELCVENPTTQNNKDEVKSFSEKKNGFKPSYGSSKFETGEEFYQFLKNLKL